MRLRPRSSSFALFFVLSITLFLLTALLRPGFADPLTLHTGRYGMPAVATGNAVYVIGGCGAQGFLNDIERIDMATGTVQDLPTALLHRRYHTAQAQGPYLYIMGGVVDEDTTSHITPIVERYDIRSGQIMKMASLPTPRRNASSILAGGKIYVIGGSTRGDKNEVGTVEIYDIKTNVWTEGAPMLTPRECALATDGTTIYVAGGFNGKVAVATVEAYTMASDTWQALPDLPVITSAHHVIFDRGFLYTFGDYAELNRVAVYNVENGTYRALTKTGYQFSRHNAAVLEQGRIYVIGGNTASSSDTALTTIQTISLAQLEGF